MGKPTLTSIRTLRFWGTELCIIAGVTKNFWDLVHKVKNLF